MTGVVLGASLCLVTWPAQVGGRALYRLARRVWR